MGFRAVWNKGQHGVITAIKEIESVLPFDLLGFDSNDGSEFLNWHLVSYLQDRGERPAVLFICGATRLDAFVSL